MRSECEKIEDEIAKAGNDNFKNLIRYTIEDIDDLFWEYDRMSTSGQETLDRLAKMYNMRYEPKTGNLLGGDANALFK